MHHEFSSSTQYCTWGQISLNNWKNGGKREVTDRMRYKWKHRVEKTNIHRERQKTEKESSLIQNRNVKIMRNNIQRRKSTRQEEGRNEKRSTKKKGERIQQEKRTPEIYEQRGKENPPQPAMMMKNNTITATAINISVNLKFWQQKWRFNSRAPERNWEACPLRSSVLSTIVSNRCWRSSTLSVEKKIAVSRICIQRRGEMFF